VINCVSSPVEHSQTSDQWIERQSNKLKVPSGREMGEVYWESKCNKTLILPMVLHTCRSRSIHM